MTDKLGMCMTCGDQGRTILWLGLELCLCCAGERGLDTDDDEREEEE